MLQDYLDRKVYLYPSCISYPDVRSELMDGGKLCFINSSLVQATTSGATNNHYGKMVNRIMVDYVGIPQIVNCITTDDIIKYYSFKVIDCDYPFINLQEAYEKIEKTLS